MCSRVDASAHWSPCLWWSYNYDPHCWVLARHRLGILLLLRWMRQSLVPSRMGVLRRQIANRQHADYTSAASPFLLVSQSSYPSDDEFDWFVYPWAFVSSISVHICFHPWHRMAKISVACPAHKKGALEALHATCAWWPRAFLCAEFVIDWLHLNNNTYDSIIQVRRSFAMIACRRSSMDVIGVGGKKSFTITSHLLIQWFKAAFHSTYGLQLVTIPAGVAAATHSGSHVDGDVGDKRSLWITCHFYIQWT